MPCARRELFLVVTSCHRLVTGGRFGYGRYGAVVHWAKVELPDSEAAQDGLRARLAKRLPVAEFNALRRELDPHNIMANELIDGVLGKP